MDKFYLMFRKYIKKFNIKEQILLLSIIISVLFLSISIPDALALEVSTDDDENAYSVIVGSSKTIKWVFSEKQNINASISYIIKIGDDQVAKGSTYGSTVSYRPSDNLEQGIYFISIRGTCRGEIAHDSVRYTVADPLPIIEQIRDQIIPGFEPYLLIGICSLLGLTLIFTYHLKFRKGL